MDVLDDFFSEIYFRRVKIFRQYSPTTRVGERQINKSAAPYAVLGFNRLTDAEEGEASVAQVGMMLSVYDATDERRGYVDLLNLLEEARSRLLSQRYLARRYKLLPPLELCVWPVDMQEPPRYFGQIDMRFEMPRPLMGLDLKGLRASCR